jgi:hypothetical protein
MEENVCTGRSGYANRGIRITRDILTLPKWEHTESTMASTGGMSSTLQGASESDVRDIQEILLLHLV